MAVRLNRSFFDRGVQTEIAGLLGVHRSTVCRDIKALLANAVAGRLCPICGTLLA
jgi:hypothetical protein